MAITLTEDQLAELRDRLKDKPRYLKIYLEVVSRLELNTLDFDFVVDKWPDFTAIVSKPNSQAMEFLKSTYAIAGKDEKAIMGLLEQPGLINWKSNAVFSAIDCKLVPAVTKIIASHCGSKASHSENCNVQCVTSGSLNISKIPEECRMTSLTEEDAELVNSTWKFSHSSSLSYIQRLISSLPSVCLYNPDGAVIGFALTYHHGFLGMLHVMEPFRRQGHSKVIMSHLAQKTLESGREAVVIIEESNEVSVKLHEKIGFNKIPDVQVQWINYSPKGCGCGPKSCCI